MEVDKVDKVVHPMVSRERGGHGVVGRLGVLRATGKVGIEV